jgi:hypothetical protein
MRGKSKEANGLSPEQLQEVLDRLDSLSMKIRDLACLPPVSDKAFRSPDNCSVDDKSIESALECFKRISESLKRHRSL